MSLGVRQRYGAGKESDRAQLDPRIGGTYDREHF